MKLTREKIAEERAKLQALKADPKFQEEDMVWKIQHSPDVQMILGAGNTAGNAIGAGLNTISGGLIPYEPLISGEGPAYEASSAGVKAIPSFLTKNPVYGVGISGAIGGLTNPEDPLGGALEGALWGLGGEVAGPAVKAGLKGTGSFIKNKVIEPLALDKKAEEMSKRVKETYEKAKESAWGKVEPMFQQFNSEPLLRRGPYGETIGNRGLIDARELYEKNRSYFTPDAKKLMDDFIKDPTIKNAQSVVQKLGIDERKISHSGDTAKELKETTFKDTKEFVREAMRERMEHLSPGFTDAYKKANQEYATNVGPYYSSDVVESAAAGNIERIPDLNKGIEESSKQVLRGYPGIGKGHELQGMNEEMAKMLGVAEMVPQGASKLAPFLGTPKARQTVYGGANKAIDIGYEKLNPILRALLQSQASQQNNY